MRRPWVLIVAVVAVLTAVRGVIALGHAGPVVYEDEYAYFRLAAWLAGEGANPRLAYYPGYALALVPAFLLTPDGFAAYRAAVVENVLLCPIGFVLALMTARRLAPAAPKGIAVAAALAFALYPPLVLYAGLTWAENTLPVLLLATALAAGWAVRRGGLAWSAPVAGAIAALLTHPRGLAVLIALVLVVLAAALAGLVDRRTAAAVAAAGVGGAVLVLVLVRNVSPPGTHYGVDSASPLRAIEHPGATAAAFAGAVLYALVATFGLMLAGLAGAGAGLLRLLRRQAGGGDVVAGLIGLTTLGLMAFSALAVSTGVGPRGDYLVYGRYGDPGYAALMVVGIAWLATGSRRRLLSFAVSGAAAVLAAVAVQAAAAPGVLAGPANFVNMLGMLPELVRAGGLEPVRIALWSLPAMALLALATLSPRYRGVALPVVVVAVFGVATTYAVRYWLRPATANAVALRAVPEAVADLAGRRVVPCVGYVAPGVTGGLAWRVTYFTGVPVRPVTTAAAARAACDGLTMVPAGAPAPAGTPIAAGPDGLLVAAP